jgi:hypothetical protein
MVETSKMCLCVWSVTGYPLKFDLLFERVVDLLVAWWAMAD